VNTNIISMQFLILTSPLPSTSSGELFQNQLRRAHLLLMVKFFFWLYERVTLPARCTFFGTKISGSTVVPPAAAF
jgi:hypothetical protein